MHFVYVVPTLHTKAKIKLWCRTKFSLFETDCLILVFTISYQIGVELCCECGSYFYYHRIDDATLGESSTRRSCNYSLLWWNVHNSVDQGFAGIPLPFFLFFFWAQSIRELLLLKWVEHFLRQYIFIFLSFSSVVYFVPLLWLLISTVCFHLFYCSSVEATLMAHYSMLETRGFRWAMFRVPSRVLVFVDKKNGASTYSN